MKKNKLIGIIHHGCAKNLVDTELMLGMLENAGYKTTLDADDEKVKTVVINTCSFIHDAEKESIKRYSQGDALFVCGNRRMQINVVVSDEELDSFGSGGGL